MNVINAINTTNLDRTEREQHKINNPSYVCPYCNHKLNDTQNDRHQRVAAHVISYKRNPEMLLTNLCRSCNSKDLEIFTINSWTNLGTLTLAQKYKHIPQKYWKFPLFTNRLY